MYKFYFIPFLEHSNESSGIIQNMKQISATKTSKDRSDDSISDYHESNTNVFDSNDMYFNSNDSMLTANANSLPNNDKPNDQTPKVIIKEVSNNLDTCSTDEIHINTNKPKVKEITVLSFI